MATHRKLKPATEGVSVPERLDDLIAACLGFALGLALTLSLLLALPALPAAARRFGRDEP